MNALLVFGEDHATVFVSNASGIGLSTQQATQFKAANDSMQLAWSNYNKAKNALKDAASAWKDARETFRTLAVADCQLIRNYAERQANPAAVFALAQIPAPSPRTPSVPPAQPTNLRATLDTQTGELTVRWDATQPKGVSGVVYQVQRVLGTGSAFVSAGFTGNKSFIDSSIPAGTTRIQYRVIGQRGSLVSPASSTLDVHLATSASGETQIAGVKLAA